MSLYYYQFNIGDYRRDTSHLTLLEHGIYRQLIDTYYMNEGPLDYDEDFLMRTHSVRNADEMQAFTNVIKDFFDLEDGRLIHRGCDKVIAMYHEKSKKASTSAMARWQGKNAKAMRTHSERNANGMLTNKPITNNQVDIKRTSAPVCPEGVGEQVWKDYIAVRKAKSSPVTDTALQAIEKEAGKAGWPLEKALKECVARGWVGFKAEWVDKSANPKLSFAERDELLKRKKWEQMTGREFPEEGQSFWTPGADMELLK